MLQSHYRIKRKRVFLLTVVTALIAISIHVIRKAAGVSGILSVVEAGAMLLTIVWTIIWWKLALSTRRD